MAMRPLTSQTPALKDGTPALKDRPGLMLVHCPSLSLLLLLLQPLGSQWPLKLLLKLRGKLGVDLEFLKLRE